MLFAEVLNADFDLQIVEKMKEWRVPGCAIALVPLGQEPIFKTYSQGCEVTTKTRFPISSITKTITALALLHALEGAGFDRPFDTLIKDILPEFKLSDPDATARCTVSDILGHRCNISQSNHLLVRPFEFGVDSMSILAKLPMRRPLREGSQIYSNTVFQVAFTLIERLTGKPFGEYVGEAVLDPLGMTSTGYSAAAAGEDLAVGHEVRHCPEGLEERMMVFRHAFDNLGPESGMASVRLISTIEDMARLLAHLPNHPHFRQMSTPPTDSSTWIEGQLMRGFGMSSILIDGHLLSGNKCSCAGFRSHVMHILSLGCGVCVMTNATDGDHLILWIEAWIVGTLTGRRQKVCDRFCIIVEKQRAAEHLEEISECPAVVGTGDEMLIGDFYSSTFGLLSFTQDCNVRIRPCGERSAIPWLPRLYGSVRPLITSMGGGRYAGCLGWTPGEDQEQSWDEQYGYPYKLHIGDFGNGEELRLRGVDGMVSMSDEEPPAVFRRV